MDFSPKTFYYTFTLAEYKNKTRKLMVLCNIENKYNSRKSV